MGPRAAADQFKQKYPNAAGYRVTLYGSLAATGKGHQTDTAILNALQPVSSEIVWKPDLILPMHPNGMTFVALDAANAVIGEWTIFSVGGGKITDGTPAQAAPSVYNRSTMNDILQWTHDTGHVFWEYVEAMEGVAIYDHLQQVWATMQAAIERGIDQDGLIPGGLRLSRKSSSYYVKGKNFGGSLNNRVLTFAYALAVAEENACGGKIVTAPTCGSCGVVPAVLKTLGENYQFSEQKVLRALSTAGLVGNIVKENASISGAKVGCQGEIGTACAMAAAAATQLLGGSPAQIEYAAEMGMEHHLGLTCDPIGGLVQIPCIERNAFAAERALNCATYALLSDGRHLVSFDKVVKTMNQTGHDLPMIYKETSEGGLAVME